jgi:DNA-binding transcriptional regulator YiaG
MEMIERAEWECSSCGAPAKVVRGKYRFVESGLPNVSLVGVKLVKCSKCRKVDPVIQDMKGLMQALALAVIEKPWKLSGTEIRYLRKYLNMTAAEFADHVGVDKTTISKWENDHDSVGDPSDRLIRALALTMGDGLKDSIDGIIRRFPGITSALKACGYKIDSDTQRVEYV